MAKKRNKTRQKKRNLWWLVPIRSLFSKPQRYVLMVFILVICGVVMHLNGTFLSIQTQIHETFIQKTAENGFVVRHVKIKGRDNVDSDVILALLNIQYNDPIFLLSPHEARQRLEQIKWVDNARVERQLPDTIMISLNEREPLFLYQSGKTLQPIDQDGFLLPEEATSQYKHLTILIGTQNADDILQADAIAQSHPDLMGKTRAFIRISDRRWDIELKNGIRIQLPAEDHNLALARLMKMERDNNILSKDIRVIDLRLPNKAAIRPTPRANLSIDRPDLGEKKGDRI